MAIKLEDKKVIVKQVTDVASGAAALVVANYRGLSVAEMTELRVKARTNNVYLRVVRNTLAKIALADTEFSCISDNLVGPVILAFSLNDEPSAAARLMRDFTKQYDKLEVTSLALGGSMLPAEQLTAVAKLPTYEEGLSKLMAAMKAPTEKLVRTIAAPHTKLVRTLAAVRDQKQAA